MITQLATARKNVSVVITALDVNPTTLPVAIAFTTPGVDPQNSDWNTATWNTAAALGPNQYLAQCLVGPGGTVTLANGTYQIWAKVTGVTEVPQEPAGMLTIY